MVEKKYKLSWKEINYMLKRGKRYFGEYFIFWVIPQYPNISFNQRAFQIPLKVDKRATVRNLLKRSCYKSISNSTFVSKTYVKVFASINKKNVEPLKELIATQNKTTIVKTWESLISKDLTLLSRKL